MGKIGRFEDLICWQKARVLLKRIYEVSAFSLFSRDFALRDQIRRASISVMLNIAEGFGRKSHAEFKHFLFLSHGSVAEIQSALYIALDLNYITDETFDDLYENYTEVSKIISGLIKSLN